MKTLKNKLLALFALQCVIAGALFINTDQSDEYSSSTPLLAIGEDRASKLIIQQGDEQVELIKIDDQWQLAASTNELANEALPAKGSKVESVLNKLSELKSSWPVATTSASHERFELLYDNHQRKISVFNDEKLVSELYLGTSPGFRKVHARIAGQDDVYSVALNVYDFPSKLEDWLDKSLLAVSDINALSGEGFSIAKSGDGWSLQKPVASTDQESNQDKITDLVSSIDKLSILGLADKDIDFDSATTINIKTSHDLELTLQEHDKSYFIKRSDFQTPFEISESVYKKIAKFDASELLISKVEDSSDEQSTEEQLANSKDENKEEVKADS